MDKWSGKVALVTGASGGIGSAMAEKLIKSGMKVVGCDCNVDVLKEMSEKLKDEMGELYVIQCDLRKEDEILSMFEEIKQKYGGVDVCVNVAGVAPYATNTTGETPNWRQILEVNVLALSICTREAIKSMKERKVAGHIVHIVSLTAHYSYAYPQFSMYMASKHAVRSLTESLRVELRQEKSDIRISSVSPGMVKTINAEKYFEDTFEQVAKLGNKMLLPEDVASAVIYMLSCPPRVQVHDILLGAVQDDV